MNLSSASLGLSISGLHWRSSVCCSSLLLHLAAAYTVSLYQRGENSAPPRASSARRGLGALGQLQAHSRHSCSLNSARLRRLEQHDAAPPPAAATTAAARNRQYAPCCTGHNRRPAGPASGQRAGAGRACVRVSRVSARAALPCRRQRRSLAACQAPRPIGHPACRPKAALVCRRWHGVLYSSDAADMWRSLRIDATILAVGCGQPSPALRLVCACWPARGQLCVPARPGMPTWQYDPPHAPPPSASAAAHPCRPAWPRWQSSGTGCMPA